MRQIFTLTRQLTLFIYYYTIIKLSITNCHTTLALYFCVNIRIHSVAFSHLSLSIKSGNVYILNLDNFHSRHVHFLVSYTHKKKVIDAVCFEKMWESEKKLNLCTLSITRTRYIFHVMYKIIIPRQFRKTFTARGHLSSDLVTLFRKRCIVYNTPLALLYAVIIISVYIIIAYI